MTPLDTDPAPLADRSRHDAGPVSVIVPFGRPVDDWVDLFARFAPLHPAMGELIVVQDGFRQAPPDDRPAYVKVVSTAARGGPAGARNLGAAQATGALLAFTDDSCAPQADWLDAMLAALTDEIDAVVGTTRVAATDWLGEAISMLGFPGGGNLGFDKLWPVRPDGSTDHLSTCNVALRAAAFHRLGGFDTSFPFPGGEDNDLAVRLRRQGSTIRHCPAAVVVHPARSGLRRLVVWQFRRGRGQYYLVRKFGGGSFAARRLGSARRSLAATWRRPYFPIMPLLIVLTMASQVCGYGFERLTAARDRAA